MFESVLMYDRNHTMQMIGRQSMGELLKNEELKTEFDDIRAAHKYDFNFELSMDAFLLGYIWGKRAERTRKEARA